MKWILVLIVSFFSIQGTFAHNFEVSIGDPSYIEPSFFNQEPGGNDTIFINPNRKKGIIFYGFAGTANQPLVIMNGNGLVSINDQEAWSGIQLKNCKHIKLSGAGSKLYRYGLKLAGSYSGVNVTQQSSNIEIEFIEIDHEGFAGIQVKDDYGGNPPFPFPTFKELVIHDCFIQNVSEGMYLGETKSPGLEFSYVKVFNNIIRNTKREGIQLANMTEDVEVYNNYISNSGRDLLSGHGNCIQIGDNTVAAVFNNVLEGAAEFGVIVFGIGHINIYNNYISNTNGIFIDNRIFSDLLAKIEINNNFFRELKLEQVVLNYNEINDLYCSQNIYEGDIPFYHSLCSNCSNNFLSNNTSQTVPSFNTLDLTDGIFIANENNDNNYLEMGPNATINYLFNSWPEFKNLKNVFVNKGEKIIHAVEAEVHDGDLLSFRFKNLPDFVSINEIQNGLIHLEVDATNQQVQIYNAEVTVIEESHKVEVKATFEIVVKSKSNQSPIIKSDSIFSFNNLEKNSITIELADPDDDELTLDVINAPSFINKQKLSFNKYVLLVQPKYSDAGSYSFQLLADDGYNGYAISNISLLIKPADLEAGKVIYRVNFGGPELSGNPINWESGKENYSNYSFQILQSTGSYSWNGRNTTSAPDSLFGPYAFIKPNDKPMRLQFECEPNEYDIKLYFSQKQNENDSLGPTLMQVLAENEFEVENIILGNEQINQAEVVQFRTNVLDSVLNLSLFPLKNYVKINGVEISVAFPFEIDELVDSPFAFPNPFLQNLYLVNLENDPIVNWTMHTFSGKKVSSGTAPSYYLPIMKIDNIALNKGMYYLVITTESKNRFQQKVIRN